MTRLETIVTAAVVALLAACGGPSKPATVGNGGGDASTAATIEPLERTVPAGEDTEEALVRRPRVTIAGNPTASAAINAALGTPATADLLDSQGEVGIDYTVGHNADGLLDVTIVHETLGAYPDSYIEHFLFDTATGARLTAAELFRADALPKLAATLDARLQAEIAAARTERTDCADPDNDPFQGEFTVDRIQDVGVGATGVVFNYDYDFPHAIQACEPVGTFAFSLPELADFLTPTSPLHRLAH